MKVTEELDLPVMVTTDATPVRLGKSYLTYDRVTRIEAIVLASELAVDNAASWHLQYSFDLLSFYGIPYQLGSGIRTKESLNGGSLWDCSIVATFNEVDDTPAKFWFEITGAAATEVKWGGRARIWYLDLVG